MALELFEQVLLFNIAFVDRISTTFDLVCRGEDYVEETGSR